jgi:hypothetical protein
VRTLGAILCTLLLSGFCAPRCWATVYQSNGSVANVQALHNLASDGDTIVLPAGTFSWTAPLNITKGITLQGQTTISGAGTANPTVSDATIVKDDVPRTSPIITTALTPTKSFRLTGITFAPGARTVLGSTDGAFTLRSDGASANASMRVDNCHFAQLYQANIIQSNGWVYGVADHNFIEARSGSHAFFMNQSTWGGANNTSAHGEWADYPWYGTEKFFFIEDNTIKMLNSTGVRAGIDTVTGGAFVVRHNYIQNCVVANHGTEGGASRGGRVCEVYDNIFNYTISAGQAGGLRSGTTLWHDNVLTGIEPVHLCSFSNFRETPARSHPVWGLADGTSPWDANDTEGNGTFVEGHPPFLFDSGTDTSSVNSQGVIHDSTKNWAPNRWVGYSVTNTNPNLLHRLGSYIISNTSKTITYSYYGASDVDQHMIFNAGDTYEIHRVLVMMDQNGSGKSDLIVGTNRPINTRTGTASWAHSSREPCYSWNNVYTPNGHVYGFGAGRSQPTTKANVDYYDLGAGFPVDSTPAQVSSIYTAALNGVDYVGPFVYPHPLVSSARVPTDVNGDGKPDFVLFNSSTRQTAIWYLNNDVLIGHAFGPTLWFGWSLVGVADFNGDGKPDYLLYNPTTGQTAIWYLNSDVLIGHAFGPTLWFGWSLVGVADFNGDGKPDYLLNNPTTRETVIWYLNNDVLIGHAFGPTLWFGWSLVGP